MLLNPVQAATTNIVQEVAMKVLDDEQTNDINIALEHNNGLHPPDKNTITKKIKKQSKTVVVICIILAVFESSLYFFSNNTNLFSHGNESMGMVSIILKNDNKCRDLFNLNNITATKYDVRGTRSTQWVIDYNDTQHCNFVVSYLYQI